MEVTDEMLAAAMKQAVATGLVPKYAAGEETYVKMWDAVRSIVEAALNASKKG